MKNHVKKKIYQILLQACDANAKKAMHSLAVLEGLSKTSASVRNGDNPVIGNVRRVMWLTQDVVGLTSHEEKLRNSVHTYAWPNPIGTTYCFTSKSSTSIRWPFHNPARDAIEKCCEIGKNIGRRIEKLKARRRLRVPSCKSPLRLRKWCLNNIASAYNKIHTWKTLSSDKNASTWSWNSIPRATRNPRVWTS